MNHRYYARMPVRLSVEIYKQKRCLGRFETRNIDMEGLFVEIGPTELQANDVVELVFTGGAGLRGNPVLHAAVIRCESDGVGMMLLDYDDDVLNVIRESKRAAG